MDHCCFSKPEKPKPIHLALDVVSLCLGFATDWASDGSNSGHWLCPTAGRREARRPCALPTSPHLARIQSADTALPRNLHQSSFMWFCVILRCLWFCFGFVREQLNGCWFEDMVAAVTNGPAAGIASTSDPRSAIRTRKMLFESVWYFPKQLWSWMGFSILPRNRLCSIIISWFRLGFRGLSPYFFGILFHHHFLVPARVPGLVSLDFFLKQLWAEWGSQFFQKTIWWIFWFRVGFRGLFSSLLVFCSMIISWFHLVLGRVRSRACLASLLAFCSIIWFWVGFRGLSPYFSNALFHPPFLVPARVHGACLPRLFPQSALGWMGFPILPRNSLMDFLVPGRVPGLVF